MASVFPRIHAECKKPHPEMRQGIMTLLSQYELTELTRHPLIQKASSLLTPFGEAKYYVVFP